MKSIGHFPIPNGWLLRRMARKTWEFFDLFVTSADHGLPPDNYQEEPKGELARRTSPTNIGLSLAATVAAHDFGFIGWRRMLDRLHLALTSIDKLERHRGHLLNWYRTDNLAALEPRYVSTVDSGNFLASLVAVRNGLAERLQAPVVGPSGTRPCGILAHWPTTRYDSGPLPTAFRRPTCSPAWRDWPSCSMRRPLISLLGGIGWSVCRQRPINWMLPSFRLHCRRAAGSNGWSKQIRERREELAEVLPWIEPVQILRENPAYFPADKSAADALTDLLSRLGAADVAAGDRGSRRS